jgi:hypothetical protein
VPAACATLAVLPGFALGPLAATVKALLGARDAPPPADPRAQPLRLECWDERRRRRVAGLTLPPLAVDRLCGSCPHEISLMGEADRESRLRKVLAAVGAERGPDEMKEWESSDEEEVTLAQSGTESEEEDLGFEESEDEAEARPPKKRRPKVTELQRVVKKRTKAVKRFSLVLSKPLSSLVASPPPALRNKISTVVTCKYVLAPRRAPPPNPPPSPPPPRRYRSSDNNSLLLTVARAKSTIPNDAATLAFPPRHLRLLLLPHPALYDRAQHKFASLKAVADFLIERVSVVTDWTSTKRKLDLEFDRSIKLPPSFVDRVRGGACAQEGDGIVVSAGEGAASSLKVSLDEITALHAASDGGRAPFENLLARISVDPETSELALDRTLHTETNTVSQVLSNVRAEVLSGGEFLFSTTELHPSRQASSAASAANSSPLILSVEDMKTILENGLKAAPPDQYDREHKALGLLLRPASWPKLAAEIIQHLVLVEPEEGEAEEGEGGGGWRRRRVGVWEPR